MNSFFVLSSADLIESLKFNVLISGKNLWALEISPVILFITLLTIGIANVLGIGVTSPIHRAARLGAKTGTGKIYRFKPLNLQYCNIKSLKVIESVPISILTHGFLSIERTKYFKTSLTLIGLTELLIHFGATIIGNFSLKCLSISKDADPEPIIGPAQNSVVGNDCLRISPTSIRLFK